MKNIKFRAWDDVNNRMVYDFYNFSKENQFKTKEGCYSCGISADKNAITASLSLQKHDDFAFRHVKYIELMQYTGLKDKHGVEIYEGDIINHYWSNEVGESFCYKTVIKNPFDYKVNEAMHLIYADELEILGNIYQNNELLEV